MCWICSSDRMGAKSSISKTWRISTSESPAWAVGATLDPLDGLFEGLDLQDPEAGDELLGLGEGAVDDGTRLAGEFDACAFGAGMEAIEGEQDASLA